MSEVLKARNLVINSAEVVVTNTSDTTELFTEPNRRGFLGNKCKAKTQWPT